MLINFRSKKQSTQFLNTLKDFIYNLKFKVLTGKIDFLRFIGTVQLFSHSQQSLLSYIIFKVDCKCVHESDAEIKDFICAKITPTNSKFVVRRRKRAITRCP